jgi:hypothetical protein
MATFKYPTGGGGSANPGAWTNIDAGDLTTDAQSYTTFNLAASALEGYAHRINIGADIGAPSNTSNMATMGILTFDTGISLDNLSREEGSNGVVQLEFEPAGVDNTSVYYTDTARPQTVMLWCGFSGPPFVAGDMVYYGHGLQCRPNISATNNEGWYNQTRIMRTQGTTTAPQGSSYGFGYRFQNLQMTATFGKSYLTQTEFGISQVDWNGAIYRDDVGYDDYAMLGTISQVSDGLNTKTTTTSETIKLGVAFQVALSTDNTVMGWDFNLKWRKLLSV